MNKYDFIREMVPKHGCRWVAEALGATETDVRDACGYLGVSTRVRTSDGGVAVGQSADATWTEAEAAAVYALYTTRGTNIPSVRERHSAAAVKRWASRHGVRAPRAVTWTDAEVAVLRREYPKLGGAIPELLDGGRRSVSAIRQKARALGVQCYAH